MSFVCACNLRDLDDHYLIILCHYTRAIINHGCPTIFFLLVEDKLIERNVLRLKRFV